MSNLVTMGLGPNQTLVTRGLGLSGVTISVGKKGGGGGVKRNYRAYPKLDIEKDKSEQWDIKLKIFGEHVQLKKSFLYEADDKIKIEVVNNNIITDDIYDIEVLSIGKNDE
jgi:hypothetical protein